MLVLIEANKEKLYFLVQLQCVTVIPHRNLTTMGESLWGHEGAFLFLFFSFTDTNYPVEKLGLFISSDPRLGFWPVRFACVCVIMKPLNN